MQSILSSPFKCKNREDAYEDSTRVQILHSRYLSAQSKLVNDVNDTMVWSPPRRIYDKELRLCLNFFEWYFYVIRPRPKKDPQLARQS
jgi:hypothetical protein